jgi:hypothetical protein
MQALVHGAKDGEDSMAGAIDTRLLFDLVRENRREGRGKRARAKDSLLFFKIAVNALVRDHPIAFGDPAGDDPDDLYGQFDDITGGIF